MLTAVNKQKHVDFAQHYGARSKRWRRNVTFTDSKYFGIGAAGRVFAWVDKGEFMSTFMSGLVQAHHLAQEEHECDGGRLR